MKKVKVMFCEECGIRHDKSIKYCSKCGSLLEEKPIKILDIRISYDYEIILKLGLIKGRHTAREISFIVGVRADQRFYEIVVECKKLKILYEDGKKILPTKRIPYLRIDKERWAEFVETHEKSKEIKKYLDEASGELY